MDLTASRCAVAAAVFFIVGMALVVTQSPPSTFLGSPPPVIVIVAVSFSLFHLLLLPVVAAVAAPAWAKGAGYGWIVVDNVLVFVSYFGVGAELVTPMRWGVHLATASWIFGASSMASGAIRWVGGLAAVAFVAASFAGPFVGAAAAGQTLGPAALLMIVWLLLIGKRLASGQPRAAGVELKTQPL